MIPCLTLRWGLLVQAIGLNGEPFDAFGFTHAHAERRWMRKYQRWLDAGQPT